MDNVTLSFANACALFQAYGERRQLLQDLAQAIIDRDALNDELITYKDKQDEEHSNSKPLFTLDELTQARVSAFNNGAATTDIFSLMLEHKFVNLWLVAKNAPFGFMPQCVMPWRLCMHIWEDETAYESNTVGIIGTNMLTGKLIFVADFEQWSVAPDEAKV